MNKYYIVFRDDAFEQHSVAVAQEEDAINEVNKQSKEHEYASYAIIEVNSSSNISFDIIKTKCLDFRFDNGKVIMNNKDTDAKH